MRRPRHVPQQTLQRVPLVGLDGAVRVWLPATDLRQELGLLPKPGLLGSSPQGVSLTGGPIGLPRPARPYGVGFGVLFR